MPLHRNEDKSEIQNCRSISMLPSVFTRFQFSRVVILQSIWLSETADYNIYVRSHIYCTHNGNHYRQGEAYHPFVMIY
jgi:hypothetical protein